MLADLPRDAPSGRERGVPALDRCEIEGNREVLVQLRPLLVPVERLAYLPGKHLHLLTDVVPVRPLAVSLWRAAVPHDVQRKRRRGKGQAREKREGSLDESRLGENCLDERTGDHASNDWASFASVQPLLRASCRDSGVSNTLSFTEASLSIASFTAMIRRAVRVLPSP